MKTDAFIGLLVADVATRPPSAGRHLRLWCPLAAIVVGAVFLLAAGVRSDVATSGLWPTAVKTMLGALLAVTATIGAFRLSRPETPPDRATSLLFWVLGFMLLLVAADLGVHGVRDWTSRLMGHSVLPCLTIVPALTVAPLLVALAGLRRGATTAPFTAGAFAGLAAAGMVIVAYGLYCTEDGLTFVATWYVLAAVLAALIGGVIGRFVLRW